MFLSIFKKIVMLFLHVICTTFLILQKFFIFPFYFQQYNFSLLPFNWSDKINIVAERMACKEVFLAGENVLWSLSGPLHHLDCLSVHVFLLFINCFESSAGHILVIILASGAYNLEYLAISVLID